MQTEQAKTVEFKSVAPSFVVSDVVATAEYYRDVLGFKILGYFGEPTVFAMVARGGVEIHFGRADAEPQRSNLELRKISSDAYIWVNDADALYKEFKAKGVKVTREIENTFYGCRDFDIEDCNGYVLCFGQDVE